MSDQLHSAMGEIEARANLAGSNKMEILLFSLGGKEVFGINVFKVREVCDSGKVTRTPNMPDGVDGITSLRGHVMPVLSLAKFMGVKADREVRHSTMMIAEYSTHVLGFLVEKVDRIIRVDWDHVRAPEGLMASRGDLITAITEMEDGTLVSILDVEQILTNAFGEAVVGDIERVAAERTIFFVDDSKVARNKIAELLEKMGVKSISAENGRDAWDRLVSIAESMADSSKKVRDQIQVILTDAEMPQMDGYVLTQKIKADPRFEGIPVVMHSSLSSESSRITGGRVGVDYYVPKFDSMVLSSTLRPLLR